MDNPEFLYVIFLFSRYLRSLYGLRQVGIQKNNVYYNILMTGICLRVKC